MSSQVLPQQDFFMYIPDFQEVTKQFREDCSSASEKDRAGFPATFNEWVKIPLEGSMTIYAHVWNEEEEIVA